MDVVVDRDKCIASGACVIASPTVFDQDEVGMVVLLEAHPPSELADEVREAERACPARVIEVR